MPDSSPDPGPGRAKPDKTVDFERGIPFLVSALGNKLSAIASRDVRQYLGVGLMEWRILALLAVESEATPGRIGQVAGVDKSVVSRAAASLEGRGLIEVAADPSASRQTRMTMTDKGLALHERGIALSFRRHEALLHGFSPEERSQLSELLRRATANLPLLEPKDEQ